MSAPRTHAWPIGAPSPAPPAGTVASVMSHPVVTIDAGVGLEQAIAKMEAHDVHHLLVTDRGMVVAVVSDRDLRRGLGIGPARRDDERYRRRPLFQVAAYQIVTIEEDASLPEAATSLLDHGVSALPVVNREDAVVGIITSRDLLRCMASGQEASEQKATRPDRISPAA